MKKFVMAFSLLCIFQFIFINQINAQVSSWRDAQRTTNMQWLKSSQADTLVETILRAQLAHGGWPKNQEWLGTVNWEEVENCRLSGYGETIDNNATVGELQFLAKYIAANNNDEKNMDAIKAFHRGIDYLLEAQYDNGGWPQFYPQHPDRADHYSRHITFNDNAMVNVLTLFQHILYKEYPYSYIHLDSLQSNRLMKAYKNGIDCILKCQIRDNGKMTVWCQQHDKDSMLPVKARAYELPSYCGAGEAVGILMFLMNIPTKSVEVENSVESAIHWLETHKIEGKRVERYVNQDGNPDIRLVNDSDAHTLWARFYSLEDATPFFCDRDGIPRKNLNEIGYERRNGYNWLNDSPQKAIDYYYNVYLKK